MTTTLPLPQRTARHSAERTASATPTFDQPRRLRPRTADDIFALAGSAGGSFCFVWLTYTRILPLSGVLGFLICWYVVFLAMYATVTAMAHPRPVLADRMASTFISSGAVVMGFALATTIVYTFARGAPALIHLNFFTHDMSGVGPQDPLSHGGLLHAIVGSLIELAIAVMIALPLGIGAAVYMTEVGGRMARVVRTVVEAMTALPDLLAGLFVYTTLIVRLGVQRSGFAAAVALTIMMLPVIARSAEVALRVVPGGLREAGLALGSTRWRTVWRVVLPTAGPGLATSLILAIARGIGETAPVLITSGASTYFNANPFVNPMNSLPLYVYSAVRSGEPIYIQRGFGAASLLLGLVLILFVFIRLIARPRRGAR